MRHFRLIWILLAGSLAFAFPSHGEVVFSAKAQSFDGVHSVEFNGQGWKNLRWITLVTALSGAKLPVTSYVVCGTGKFLIPTVYAAPGPHEIYPDKDRSDAVVSLGGLREISAKEFLLTEGRQTRSD